MFKPAVLYIGLRYTRAKRKNHFISFISAVSILGIALGITVLITVLSVMNGFDKEIKKRVFSLVPPITVTSTTGSVENWQALQQFVAKTPGITASAPFVTSEVLLNFEGSTQPAIISGIIPVQEEKISQIGHKIVQGELNLKPGQFNVVLGENLAELLGAKVGDKVTVMTPQVSLSPAGVIPRFKRFTVVGMFRAGGGFKFDRALGFVDMHDAQALMGLGENVTGLHLSTPNVFAAPHLATQLAATLNSNAMISTWADEFGDFFHAVQLEKTMMFFILLLIIAVAAFNLVSTLMMVVNEKEADIAILRTFGATPKMIMRIFILQGAFIGIFGTLIGVLGGLLLAYNVTAIVNGLEHLFHVQLLSSNVYFVDYLPSKIEIGDILKICFASLILSLLATIYPAWRASKTDPVESLRYE
jgi:lipoprotein-releasing system permease protein